MQYRKQITVAAIVLLTGSLIVIGCASLKSSDLDNLAAEIAARHAGAAVAEAHPEWIEPINMIGTAVLTGQVPFGDAYATLTGYVDDPLLKADIEAILAAVNVEPANLSVMSPDVAEKITRAFMQGVEYARTD